MLRRIAKSSRSHWQIFPYSSYDVKVDNFLINWALERESIHNENDRLACISDCQYNDATRIAT